MNLLLDTHVLLWWLDDPNRIAEPARHAIANGRNTVLVSAASVLEIRIKEATQKLRCDEAIEAHVEACRFNALPITLAHAFAMKSLPLLHKDPFDRILVVQAREEGLTLVTKDTLLEGYGVPILIP